MLSRSSRIRPSSVNMPRSLFTLCRVQPIIAARSPWVSGDRSRIVPSASFLPDSRRQPGEARCEPAGDVEEVELLDVVRQPAELRGERSEQRVDDRRLGGEQLAELGTRQDQRLRRLEGRRRRGSRRPIEQRQLTEDVAGTERRENGLVAGVGREHDLDRARHDDEERVTGVAEVEDHFATAEAPGAHPASDALEAGRIQPGEEWDAGQRLGERAGLDHESHRTALRRTSRNLSNLSD